MIALSAMLMFAGYLLMFASVANGGVFALRPWSALWHDAYNVQGSPDDGGGGEHGPATVPESEGVPSRPRANPIPGDPPVAE